MFPQYEQRQRGGEIAVWLLITVGALLIPIIIIAICCIRRHWLRRPHIKLLQDRSQRTMTNLKRAEDLRSYNGPYIESGNDDVGVSSENNMTPNFSRTNSLKKQHVHWPDRTDQSKSDNFHSILTESPSKNRRHPLPNSTLSQFIQTAIIPAGSTVNSGGANQFLTPSKEFTSVSVGI